MDKSACIQVAGVMNMQLDEGETALDEALTKSANLIVQMAAVRRTAGLSVYHGQDAMEKAHGVVDMLLKTRREMGALHKTLAATHRQIIGTTAVGPTGKPEEGDFPNPTGLKPDLKVVAA